MRAPKGISPSDLPWRQRPTKSLAKPGTVAIRSGASAISLDSRTKARAVAAKVKAHATRPWPEAGLLLLRDCFDPVECLLDPLTNAQADGIAAVPQAFVRQSQSYGRRCSVQRAASLHRAQLVDEVFCVAGFVDARRDRGRLVGTPRDHVQRGAKPIFKSTSSAAIAPSMARYSLRRTAF